MRTVKEPDKLQSAVGGLWSAYLAVLATLRLEFARVAALALGIADMVKFRMLKWLAPPLCQLMGPELRHWVPTLISTGVNIVAVVGAWYLQQVVSAFYSALRGGKLFASALLTLLDERGWLAKLPCVAQPFDPDDSHVDEALGYALAALGFLVGEQVEGSSFLFDSNVTGPAINHFQQVPGLFWGLLGAAIFTVEASRVQYAWQNPFDAEKLFLLKDDYTPGDYNFDPLKLSKGKDEAWLNDMKLKEINNVRVAMVAISGMIAQELVNGLNLIPEIGRAHV